MTAKKLTSKTKKKTTGSSAGTEAKTTAKKSRSAKGAAKVGAERISSYPGAVRWLLELHDVERQRVVHVS